MDRIKPTELFPEQITYYTRARGVHTGCPAEIDRDFYRVKSVDIFMYYTRILKTILMPRFYSISFVFFTIFFYVCANFLNSLRYSATIYFWLAVYPERKYYFSVSLDIWTFLFRSIVIRRYSHTRSKFRVQGTMIGTLWRVPFNVVCYIIVHKTKTKK